MTLRFFADHCVPHSIVRGLEKVGLEVFKLKDYLPRESPDTLVIAKAQELNAILISLNGDFADIVSYPPSRYQGIVAVQVRNHPEVIPRTGQLAAEANGPPMLDNLSEVMNWK